jgi:hypothetical protein
MKEFVKEIIYIIKNNPDSFYLLDSKTLHNSEKGIVIKIDSNNISLSVYGKNNLPLSSDETKTIGNAVNEWYSALSLKRVQSKGT